MLITHKGHRYSCLHWLFFRLSTCYTCCDSWCSRRFRPCVLHQRLDAGGVSAASIQTCKVVASSMATRAAHSLSQFPNHGWNWWEFLYSCLPFFAHPIDLLEQPGGRITAPAVVDILKKHECPFRHGKTTIGNNQMCLKFPGILAMVFYIFQRCAKKPGCTVPLGTRARFSSFVGNTFGQAASSQLQEGFLVERDPTVMWSICMRGTSTETPHPMVIKLSK